jgi:hypothetical protein
VRALALSAALTLAACAGGTPAASPSGASPYATATDAVGNVITYVTDDTWKELAARPLRLGSTAPGSDCAVTSTAQFASGTGALAGTGRIYAVGNVIAYGSRLSDGIYPAKVLWVSAPDYFGPALIRGRRLDGPGGIFFSNSRQVTELRFELDTRVRASASDQGWRYLPSTVNVEGPGCYGFQIDGPGWTETIVMRATS